MTTMRRTGLLVVVALAIASGGVQSAPPPTPVIVELFTSEGCIDCPPADTLLEKLLAAQPVAGAEIIGLGEHVDYWDRLGWKDRFSSARLTDRQQIYQARFNTESIYTPQMVVDGRAELIGSDGKAARNAIKKAIKAPHGVVRLSIGPGARTQGAVQSIAVTVTASDLPRLGPGDHADIVVAVTEDHLQSDVKRGENRGRKLTHAAVVRHMAIVGQARAGGVSSARTEVPLSPDWRRDALKVVAFVQEQRGRAILGAAALKIDGR